MSLELRRYARLLEHDRWANAETLRCFRDAAPAPGALRWMGHIIGAEYLWLARLRQEPPTLAVWPELDLDSCAARLAELEKRWPEYLEELLEEDLEDGRAYRNSLGEFWTSTVGDILTHVVMHSTYHRGQIAAAVRQAGGTPAYTDFIHAVRQGLIE